MNAAASRQQAEGRKLEARKQEAFRVCGMNAVASWERGPPESISIG
jgi:hypothetical protein